MKNILYFLKTWFRKYLNDEIWQKTTLEWGCLIGARAIILPGVTIGSNSIVAAGSVVAGNPAKIISTIKDYIERNNKRLDKSDKYDIEYTINGGITDLQKEAMYHNLNNGIAYVK